MLFYGCYRYSRKIKNYVVYGGLNMSIPIIYKNEKYFIVDKNTLKFYNLMLSGYIFFSGFVFIDGIHYKKYEAYDRKLLLEV